MLRLPLALTATHALVRHAPAPGPWPSPPSPITPSPPPKELLTDPAACTPADLWAEVLPRLSQASTASVANVRSRGRGEGGNVAK